MILNVVTFVVLPMLALASLACAWRVLRGPTLADRAVGLEVFATIGAGIAVASSVVLGQRVLVDVGLVFALVAFLGAIAFARALEVRQ